MGNHEFWRESNIWRVVGLAIVLFGVMLSASPFDSDIYTTESIKITTGHALILFGFVGFYPTLREALAKKIKNGEK